MIWTTITGRQRDSLRIRLAPGLALTESTSESISVGAEDPENFVYQELVVEVSPSNHAPVVDPPLRDTTLASGGSSVDITLSDHFSDPDGDKLTYTVTSSNDAVVEADTSAGVLTVTSGSTAGTATITVTARDPGGLSVPDMFDVTVDAADCRLATAFNNITLPSGGSRTTIRLSDHFSSDCAGATYSASSSASGVAMASTADGVLTVTPGTVTQTSTSTITVSAMKDGQTVSGEFVVTVSTGCVITVKSEVADTTLASHGYKARYTLSDHFSFSSTCANRSYLPSSSNAAVATTTESNGALTVTTGSTTGTATITVTASATGATSASDAFVVTVTQNLSPVVDNAIANVTAAPSGAARTYTLSDHFTDPDGNDDDLRYNNPSPTSSNTSVATAAVANGVLTVTPGSTTGTSTITVTARDPGELTAPDIFVVTVTAGCTGTTPIPNQSLVSGGSGITVTLSNHFSSACTVYSESSSNTSVATVSETSGTLTVTPGSTTGTSTITVTASGSGTQATDAFVVTVTAGCTGTTPIPNQSLVSGGSGITVTLSNHFSSACTAYSESSSNTSVATVSETSGTLTVTPGSTTGTSTITVTASGSGTQATDAFDVTVSTGCGITLSSAFSNTTLTSGGSTATYTLSDHFSFSSTCTSPSYSATSSNAAVASASVASGTLTVRTGNAGGTTTITVTASATGATSVSTTFEVEGNRRPVKVGMIPDVAQLLGTLIPIVDLSDVDLSDYFSDPDNDRLTYAATSGDDTKVGVSVSGSTLTLTAKMVGEVGISATATDEHGATSMEQEFTVTLRSKPEGIGTIPPQSLYALGASKDLDLTPYFMDQDGDAMSYAAQLVTGGEVRTEDFVTFSVSGSTLTMTPLSTTGTRRAVVTATDRDGSGEQRFSITVSPNKPPAKVGTIPDQTLQVSGTALTLNVSGYFRDPEGHSITSYAASSSATSLATASMSTTGSTLTVTPLATTGTSTISVTATDEHNATSMAQEFDVLVCGAPSITNVIAGSTILLDATATLALDDYFSNPNTGSLSYTATPTGAITVWVSGGNTLTIDPEAVGSASVTVTARGCGGRTTPQTFAVTVRSKPVANGTIPNQKLTIGGSSKDLDVSSYFTDPDGDDTNSMTYSARVVTTGVRIPDYVSVSMSGSTLTMTPGTTAGSIGIEVTATDRDGSFAQTFTVTVSGGS